MKHVFFLPLIFFIYSCSKPHEEVPDKLLSPDSMVSILVDIHLTEAASGVTRINDVQPFKAQELYPSIFKLHRTDSVTFHNSFNYYLKNPEKFEAIYDRVLNELSRRESESGKP